EPFDTVDGVLTDAQGAVSDLGPSAAVYHLLCDPNNALLGFNDGDAAAGLVLCEVNESSPGSGDGLPGAGGLCYMSPGFVNGATSCDFVNDVATFMGNSNGNAPDYNGVGTCNAPDTLPVIASPARAWYTLTMQGTFRASSGNTPFGFQIASVSCEDSAGALVTASTWVYDDQFAYTVDSGHVAGFPSTGPTTPNGYGGYTIVDNGSTAGMTACAGPRPIYYA
ncbi:MAG: hypothetical protein ABR562_02490, partial [Thermoplasmatota archaeon]